MADSLQQLLRLFGQFDDEDDHVQTQTRNHANPVAVAPQHNATVPKLPRAEFNNTGTQNMKGLINNTGYTKGNGNGSIVFGGFDSSSRTYN